MKRFLILPSILTILFLQASYAQAPINPPGTYTTSWLGNTYMDVNGNKVVTEELNSICLSPDGIVFTAGYAEAFGGGASFNASDGSFAGRYGNTNSGFGDPLTVVAADNDYVYYGAGIGILRAPHGGAQGGYDLFLNGIDIQGLYLKSGRLYVSDFSNNKIRVINTSTMTEEMSWSCLHPTRLTVDNSGKIWVVRWDSTSVQLPSDGPVWKGDKILSFSSTGTPGPQITDFDQPLSVAVNNNGQLLVGGLNVNSQILIYNVSGIPYQVGTFGAPLGIFSGTAGAFTNSAKLHWIKAISVDKSGDIYTGCTYGTFWGDCVEKFNSSGALQWRVFAGTSLDCAGIDPDNETEVYSKFHHYSLDYTKTFPGTEWSLKGFTVNRFKYPNDPRVDQNTDVGSRSLGAGTFRLGGKLFVARSSQEGYRWEMYRQETSTDGEVLVPSVNMGAGSDPDNHFYDPTTKSWIDKPKKDNLYNQYWCVAKNGDLFTIADNPDMIIQYKFGGLDANSNPVWDASNATVTHAPEFQDLRRLYYDSGDDAMYMAGDVDNGNYGSFLRVKKFANWSTGNRTSAYTAELPYNDASYAGASNYGGGQAVAFSVSGDYIFILYGVGHVRVLSKSDGTLIGTMQQNINGWHGSDGQVDAAYGMTVTQRANGEYVILFENAAWANIMMYRWQPPQEGVLYLTSPADSGIYKVGPTDSLTLSAFIADRNHLISKVAFYDGITLIAVDSTSPYSQSWKASIGNHAIRAISYNYMGTATDTTAVAYITVEALPDLIVTNINWLPVNPKPGDSLIFQATVKNIGLGATPDKMTLGGVWSVNGNGVNYTDNYNSSLAAGDSVLLTATGGWTTGAQWVLPGVGSNTVNFLVDDVNRIQESNENNNTLNVKLCVDSTGGKPSAEITYPLDGDSLTTGDNIIIKASYLDCGGTITKVDFYRDKTLLAEFRGDTTTFNWVNIPPGNFRLRVKVTDNHENKATSKSVTVHVTSAVSLPLPLVKLDFDENAGTTTANTGSIGGNLTLTTPVPARSKNVPVPSFNSSVDFGTVIGDYAVESGVMLPQLTGLSDFTITGWVNNKDNTEGGGGNRIVTWLNDGGDGAELVYKADGSLEMGINAWSDAGGNPRSSPGKITTDPAGNNSNWKYFAATYESSTGLVDYYFGDTSTSAKLDISNYYNQGIIGNNIGSLAIGNFNNATRSNAPDRMFRGLIDHIRIYGTVLRPSQIIYDQGTGKALVSSLITHAECKDDKVRVTWISHSNMNAKYFIVQRSSNGVDFRDIAKIESKGHSSNTGTYTYNDNHAPAGVIYYRVQQADGGGTVSHSNIFSISCREHSVFVYPNPVLNELHILVQEVGSWKKLNDVFVEIVSTDGRIVKQKLFKNSNGELAIDASSLHKGIYIVKIITKTSIYTTKFLKQ